MNVYTLAVTIKIIAFSLEEAEEVLLQEFGELESDRVMQIDFKPGTAEFEREYR